ncbi:hypothetical protein MRB53_027668 [Persea americana]|uniref:Uncharacterized protein n=1 Tax=Persea americana TaxID=3435 RepID=A0ACC2LLJ8_PERAE|nr:hypothetical protein MRB53_027668 [Persea americana]|eukprot:TRINITY_DN27667_c0_g1_i1.p1 TRINITY_DN27667_c0_g1~~TRINITY_DN27667_c0_g1_i1.p1  ORF type:complete len:217 (+),score=48.38 TRINITY_DN27667_c0_g1_i1:79-651(+)
MEGHCFSISLKPILPKTPPIFSSSTFFTNKFIRNRERLSFPRVRASVEDGFVASRPEESFYELLGISEKVGFSEIKQAYKQMARKYHPDVSPPDQMKENTKRFILVQEAYETLSDPRSRALYDRDLARGLHLALSARRRFEEDLEEKSEWRNRWQGQVTELKRRSMNKDSGENMSWGARMRRQKKISSEE